jgi:hypothetical protein
LPFRRAVTVVPLETDSFDLTELPEPPATDGPILVKTRAIGVCATAPLDHWRDAYHRLPTDLKVVLAFSPA